MIVRTPRPDGNFYILDKAISEDARLSWAARGLLVYLLGKPDHWHVSNQALINETADSAKPAGREAVANMLNELIACGYCTRVQPRLPDGKLAPVAHHIHEAPAERWVSTKAPQTGLPRAVNPQPPPTGLPRAANPRLVSIDKKASIEVNNYDAGARGELGGKEGTPALTAAPQAQAKPPAEKLSFDNQIGEFKGLSDVLLGKWQTCFPLVNVALEMGRAGAWLLANPIHDKKNYQRFLHNWLSRTQDRAATQASQAARPAAPGTGRPLSRAERGQAAGMAMLGIPAEAYLPGAPMWTHGASGGGDVIDITLEPRHLDALQAPRPSPRSAS